MPHRVALRVLTLVLASFALAACTTVHVDTYPTEPGTRTDCDALLHDLPERLAALDARRVRDDVAGAWGEPSVVLRCGVERSTTGPCTSVAGQTWRRALTSDGTTYVSTGRRFAVSVEVPSVHRADPVLAAVVPVLDKHDPGRPGRC